jgi:hypothetical protein
MLHVIKNADAASPSVHSFPIDAEALTDIMSSCSMRHLRVLSAEQLRFLSDHLKDMNADLESGKAARKEAAAAAVESTTPTDAANHHCPPDQPTIPIRPLPLTLGPPPQEQPVEEDFESPWVLEGIDIELEPETFFRNAEHVPRRRRGGLSPLRETVGVRTWKPVKGPQKEIVAVYSRMVATRGTRRGWFGPGRHARRSDEEVWTVVEDEKPPRDRCGRYSMVESRRGRHWETMESDLEVV